ncbi:hypothetical protein Landi51_09134 [Colletotrichum acutatum]
MRLRIIDIPAKLHQSTSDPFIGSDYCTDAAELDNSIRRTLRNRPLINGNFSCGASTNQDLGVALGYHQATRPLCSPFPSIVQDGARHATTNFVLEAAPEAKSQLGMWQAQAGALPNTGNTEPTSIFFVPTLIEKSGPGDAPMKWLDEMGVAAMPRSINVTAEPLGCRISPSKRLKLSPLCRSSG